TGISALGTGVATFLGTPSSANLATALTDETGTGAAVFATSPTLVTPNIGVANGTSLALTGAITGATGFNGLVITPNTGTITTGVWNGTALTDAFVSDTLTSSLFVGSGSTTNAIDLATAEVAGILSIANGGTGSATQNFVDLTTAQSVGGAKTFTGNIAQTGATTFSTGTGAVTLNGNAAISGANTFTTGTGLTTISGAQLQVTQAIANLATGGAIGTAASTVDVASSFNITQTTAGQTITLPSPTTTTAGRIATVQNTGTASFTLGGLTLTSGSSAEFVWNGTAWVSRVSSPSGAVTTLATPSGSNANGGSISGNTLTLSLADGTNPGLVSTGAQTFAGAKTFSSAPTISPFTSAGIVKNSAAGLLSSGLILNADITNGTIDLTTKVTGVLPAANGGTGISALGTGVATFLGTPSSANLATALTDETGTG
ncbi:MAG: hypothetical protein ABL859_07625, partial [Methylotenera sp.]